MFEWMSNYIDLFKLSRRVNYWKHQARQLYEHYVVKDSVEVHHGLYVVNYTHSNHNYKVVFPRMRGPCPFTSVTTLDDIDVTNEVKTFMGPSYNFHGIPTTPGMLGYSKLVFYDFDNECGVVFNMNDVINL
jgi:hypothetical protein